MSDPVTRADLAALEAKQDLVVEQQTPIRVLHRRTRMTRPKTIHSMRCEWLNPHYFHIEMVAQAGTYIKEFVHGDMGRTNPSLAALVGAAHADILQLDVTEVFLDFPPPVPRPGDEAGEEAAGEVEAEAAANAASANSEAPQPTSAAGNSGSGVPGATATT